MNIIQKPDLYHGKNKEKNFFEGWYFKVVDKKIYTSLHLYQEYHLETLLIISIVLFK